MLCRLLVLLFCWPSLAWAKDLKMITYNVWHGLSGDRQSRPLESSTRRRKRFNWQIEELRALAPDVLFLQEVNPISEQAQWYARSLNMDVVYAADNCGIKLGPIKIPKLMHSGVAILARKELSLHKLKSYRLSGWGRCGQHFGFQLSEVRVGLLAEIRHPELGKFLLANTHLHHKGGLTESYRGEIASIVEEFGVSERKHQKLLRVMRKGDRKRIKQMRRLLRKINKWKRKGNYKNIILAGDLNTSPDLMSLYPLSEYKLVDSFNWGYRQDDDKQYTWDPKRNFENFSLSTAVEARRFNKPNQNDLETRVWQAQFNVEYQAKRIDYILVSENIASHLGESRLVLDDSSSEGLFGSDHFGVQIVLSRE